MIKSAEEIRKMRQGGMILAGILQVLAEKAVAGVSADALNAIAEDMIARADCQPAFKGYSMSGLPPFPCVLCVSINEEVVHGLAVAGKVLRQGDIVGLDLGLVYQGMYLDAAISVGVGKISSQAERLLEVTRQALELGIKQVKPGNTTGDIGHAVQQYVEAAGFGVVRELVGHGVGHSVHEPPQVPNYGLPKTGDKLAPGMTIAIEPMVTVGDWRLKFAAKDWPVVTKDRSVSAHFEHTVLVTDGGSEILTRT